MTSTTGHSSNGAPSFTASFRDPAGSLFAQDGRIFRAVNGIGLADLNAFLASRTASQWTAAGRLVRSEMLSAAAAAQLLENPPVRALCEAIGAAAILEHERIPFPSFPYEWPPEMLHAAGMLTLDLARDLLPDGLGLKDGTPYNVLFHGPQPVFIDALSVERRDPRDATWLAYAQFVRTFVLPLLANQAFGIPCGQLLMGRRDGLDPEEIYRWTPVWKRLLPPFLSLVSLPVWLAGRHQQLDSSIYQKKLSDSPEKARFIFNSLLNGLRRAMRRLSPPPGKPSAWSNYMTGNHNYTREHFQAKERFVQGVLNEFSPRRVLDAGCNTGYFSRLAARSGAAVVALDYDPVVVGEVWRNALAGKLDILPLVVDLTRPTPGTGWYNAECSSFLDRAQGRFDAVFMLALIHHMLVTERIPLPEILRLAAGLTSDLLLIEFIGPEDSMFRRLTRGREELHRNLTSDLFERESARYFEMVRGQRLEGTHRWLYLLRKREAGAA
jgi:SAM-dependent methyltransferase